MSTLKPPIAKLKWSVASIFRGHRRGRLVRHYFFISLLLIAGGLISSVIVEIYFRYRESQEQIAILEHKSAAAVTMKIEQFVQGITTAITAATKSRENSLGRISPEYKFELKRLLFLAPAITEAVAFDLGGEKQAHVSRTSAVSHDINIRSDFTASLGFQRAVSGKPDYGPVYFVQNSEPYMTVAFPIEQYAGTVIGVLQAEVNLKYVWDIVTSIKVGEAGYAYVVSRSGDLVSHRDISLVLQRRNLGHLPQVKAAFQAFVGLPRPELTLAYSVDGEKVITASAYLPSVQWVVVIERPVREAFGPLYASILRTSTLLLVGLGVVLLATLLVSRRVVRPLEMLRQGVERIREGDLSARLDIRTGDEIEILAEEFNEMAAHLKDAYTGLERKVAERTQALTIANSRLEEASRHKSEFLANVNHELRTPVSAIINYSGLVLNETEGQISQLQKENLQDLLNNAERLLQLIDGLLDIAKIEAGRLEVYIEAADLEEIVESVTPTIEAILKKDRVRMICDLDANLPVLNTDRDKLRQIILNLLDNAAKFTEDGEIRITATEENSAVKLVVSDTGIGIPAADLNRVFDEFHRVSNNGTKYRGTGLGLAIVKRLVDLLGGSIEVSSEVNVGSTFTVMLPPEYKARSAA